MKVAKSMLIIIVVLEFLRCLGIVIYRTKLKESHTANLKILRNLHVSAVIILKYITVAE